MTSLYDRYLNLVPKICLNFKLEFFYRLIENHSKETKVKCAKVFLIEWGTSGRVRPTLKTLQKLLLKALMFKAVDAIAIMLGGKYFSHPEQALLECWEPRHNRTSIVRNFICKTTRDSLIFVFYLSEPLPERPAVGPEAHININVTDLLNADSVTQQINTTTSEDCNATTRQMESLNLIKFSTNSIDSLREQSVEQISASNMIQFSNNISDSQFIPVSDILNPKSENQSNSSTQQSNSSIQESNSSIQESNSNIQESNYSIQQSNSSTQQSIFCALTDNDILKDDNLIQFHYKELETITNKFSDVNLIGCGGFGDVFAGNHYSLGGLAVKKVHEKQNVSLDIITKMFNTEVKLLSLLRHDNIVPILGFSIDGPVRCIVCKYIDGGTLKQKIAVKGDKALNKNQRMKIMTGVAAGLRFIHNTKKPSSNALPSAMSGYFIHGDVKSSNILLTKDCFPKLCDFGLAKQFERTYVTLNIMGTREYMAPESISGTITQKSDVYSYGMVLLELLTGSEPIVTQDNASMNIKNYLEDELPSVDGDITPFLDSGIGEWIEAQSIYGIAKLCLNKEPKQRPSMDEISGELHNIQNIPN